MIAALIKFAQLLLAPPAGQALVGVAGSIVTATNGNNADVHTWEWEWIGLPTASALAHGIFASGNVPSITFTPDVAGTYVLALRVYDKSGNVRQDTRCFIVPEASGRYIPNFGADPSSFNYGGQKYGWHPTMESYLKAIDAAVAGSGAMTVLTKAGNYTLAKNESVSFTTNSTASLPAAPANGDSCEVYALNAAGCTVAGNGHNIAGAATEVLAQYESRLYRYDSANTVWLRL